jgi:capsular polysaccharide biosynthesis protein
MILLRNRVRFLVAVPLGFALVVAGVSLGLMQDEYTAEVSIYALAKSTAVDTADSVTYNDLSASQMLANDFAEIAKNDQIIEDTAKALGLDDLSDYDINVTSSNTTRIIKLTVVGHDRVQVARIADEMTNQLGEAAMRVMDLDAVNVVNPARVPTEPRGPPRVRFTILSLPVGFLLAVAIVILRDILDTRVHSGSEIEDMLGISVIGHVPVSKER